MTSPTSPEPADAAAPAENIHWRRNLAVCFAGSFSTIVAMTLLLPFLPLYVEELGVQGHAAIVQWSGVAYGATFFAAALVAPLWGRLGDRYGRKLMLVRASFGMAICMSLTGMVQNVWQLVLLRLLVGLAGGVIFLAFLATVFLIKEMPRPAKPARSDGKRRGGWAQIPDKRPVAAMLATGMLLMFATMSIEPIITVYVGQLVDDPARVTLVSGVVMSAAALGAILSASRLGRMADRVGHWTVIIGALAVAALLLVPQAFVTAGWQLVALRFLMGLALGGLLPCVTSVIRHNVPDGVGGNVLGMSISAQYAGQVAGPLLGGFIGGHFGMPAVFLGTAVLLALGALANGVLRARHQRALAEA
ncbi:Multidrug-efflux transporter, major facilitator superfamily (MFS) [Achromobacter xylosoxidans]|nr:Multidrug-efflux transporter, major facilitator superfamily (MFS) [Achromobacter xylosoxidans]